MYVLSLAILPTRNNLLLVIETTFKRKSIVSNIANVSNR